MIVLDAGVLITFLNEGDAHHQRTVAMLSREMDEDFAVLLSVIDRHARLASFDDRLIKAAQGQDIDIVSA